MRIFCYYEMCKKIDKIFIEKKRFYFIERECNALCCSTFALSYVVFVAFPPTRLFVVVVNRRAALTRRKLHQCLTGKNLILTLSICSTSLFCSSNIFFPHFSFRKSQWNFPQTRNWFSLMMNSRKWSAFLNGPFYGFSRFNRYTKQKQQKLQSLNYIEINWSNKKK